MSKQRPRLMIAAALMVGVWLAAMGMGIRIERLPGHTIGRYLRRNNGLRVNPWGEMSEIR